MWLIIIIMHIETSFQTRTICMSRNRKHGQAGSHLTEKLIQDMQVLPQRLQLCVQVPCWKGLGFSAASVSLLFWPLVLVSNEEMPDGLHRRVTWSAACGDRCRMWWRNLIFFNECLYLYCGVSLSRYRTALEGDGPPSRKHALSRAAVFWGARISMLETRSLQSGAKAALIW